MMFIEVFFFELKYQLRSPAFWTSAIAFGLVAFFVMTVNFGTLTQTHFYRNAPCLLVKDVIGFASLFSIAVAAMSTDIIVRDEITDFKSVIYVTRVRKSDYIWAKLLSAFFAASLCFLVVPIGLFLGSSMPWIEPTQYCPQDLRAYWLAYSCFGLPLIFVLSSGLACVATVTHSKMAAYVAVVLFLASHFISSILLTKGDALADFIVFADVSAFAEIYRDTQMWTTAEINTKLPHLSQLFYTNRLLCLALGLGSGVLMTAFAKLRGGTRRRKRKRINETPYVAPPKTDVSVQAESSTNSELLKFLERWRLEVSHIVLRPSYLVMLLIAFILCFVTNDSARQLYGASIFPVTRLMISETEKGVVLFSFIASIFYGGEIVWREREFQTAEIIESTPVSDWAYLSAKLAALVVALEIILLMCPLAGMLLQIHRGYYQFEFAKYFLWFLWPNIIQFFYYAVLAIFFQTLSPNKYIGWGITVLFLGFLACQGILIDYHVLYYFAATPPVPLSDLNGEGSFWIGRVWLQLYWGAFCVIMLVIAHALYGRGVSWDYRTRLAQLPSRLTVRSRVILATAVFAFVALGGFIFYNTNVLNEFWSKQRQEQWCAEREQLLTKLSTEPEPSIVDIKLHLDIFPTENRLVSAGSYKLKNKTHKPLKFAWVESPRGIEYESFSIGGAHEVMDYHDFDIKKYQFDKPLQPEEETTLTFAGEIHHQGFAMNPQHDIVDNGSFLLSGNFTPALGIRQTVYLTDKLTRKKFHLPLDYMRALKAPGADEKNYIGGSWATSDITVSTSSDQTPFCPGVKVSDSTDKGRRSARFVSTQPILSYFSVQSGRYESRHRLHQGIDLGVYFHPQHAYDIDRMLDALGVALDYYQTNFGPYQFKSVNVIESPDFRQIAVSLAGTIPFSEGIGFVADIKTKDVDYVSYITAHELAHQWWAHQIVGADEQGATLLSEALAQYSALMVMEKKYGPTQVKNLLAYELRYYLKSRSKEQFEELPLIKVENQPYLHYNKAAIVFYLIKDHLGEATLNGVLRDLLNEYKYKGPPYPTSQDLEKRLLAAAKPEDKVLIKDLLERIFLMEFYLGSAKTEQQSDGTYKTKFNVDARKYFADGEGNYTEAPFEGSVDVGCFDSDPKSESMPESDVLLLERRKIKQGPQWITVITRKRPHYVAVDPYYKWITRDDSTRSLEVP